MSFFNVLKGAYPSLRQLDKTLPLGAGATSIVRGTCMKIDAGTFVIADSANGGVHDPGPVIYFSFQNASDPDVKMAGGITGMPCTMPCEVETDMYSGAPVVGNFLMSGAAGVLAVHTGTVAAPKTAVGLVTKAPAYRWSNQAVQVAGVSTGNKIQTIAFWTMYAPNLAVGA